MILYTLRDIFDSDLQQTRRITVLNAVSFLCMSQLQVPVPLLRISNSKTCSMFKSPFMLLMIVNNEGKKLFLMVKYISNKGSIAKHSFTKVYPSPVTIKLGARKCTISSCLFIKLKKKRLFPSVSAIYIVFKNEWLAIDSQNAILNNFEEYYK